MAGSRLSGGKLGRWRGTRADEPAWLVHAWSVGGCACLRAIQLSPVALIFAACGSLACCLGRVPSRVCVNWPVIACFGNSAASQPASGRAGKNRPGLDWKSLGAAAISPHVFISGDCYEKAPDHPF